MWFPRAELLRYEEIVRLVRIAVGRGVRACAPDRRRAARAARPARADPPARREPGRRGPVARRRTACCSRGRRRSCAMPGLGRINVSLDTLDPERFVRLTRRDGARARAGGARRAAAAGSAPIKVNTVLLRGVNDDEIEPLVARARASRAGSCASSSSCRSRTAATWDRSRVVSGAEIRARIAARWPLDADRPDDPHAPAMRFRFRDGRGAVGFIDSVTRAVLCDVQPPAADRRTGKLRVCLYDDRRDRPARRRCAPARPTTISPSACAQPSCARAAAERSTSSSGDGRRRWSGRCTRSAAELSRAACARRCRRPRAVRPVCATGRRSRGSAGSPSRRTRPAARPAGAGARGSTAGRSGACSTVNV